MWCPKPFPKENAITSLRQKVKKKKKNLLNDDDVLHRNLSELTELCQLQQEL